MIIETETLHITNEGLNNDNFVYITIVDEHTKEESTNAIALNDIIPALEAFDKLRVLTLRYK